jgi:ferredoxin, 2Fe-2S
MIKLHIKNLSGTEQTVEVEPTGSLMEAIRDSGFQDLLALCGGCCSCATCHIVVESDFVAPEPMSSEEDDLLDGSDHRQAGSRLSCQVPLTEACDGLRLRIVPAD